MSLIPALYTEQVPGNSSLYCPPPKSCAIKSVFDYIYIIGDITDYFGKCLVNIKSATNTVLFLMFFLVF